jgi:predicted GH43/DUF377 family glycosyl hydrolase
MRGFDFFTKHSYICTTFFFMFGSLCGIENVSPDFLNEEIWKQKVLVGEHYEKSGQWDQALFWYLEAFQFLPEKGDSILYRIAKHYRFQNKNNIAHLFAHYGKSTKKNSTNFDLELSIASFYTPFFKEDGLTAANCILLQKNTAKELKELTYKNLLFYIKNLDDVTYIPLSIQPLQQYLPMNASIIKTTQGYDVICRTVNYTLEGRAYSFKDPLDRTVRTINILVHYNKNLQQTGQEEIIENLPRQHVKKFDSVGLEDCRLFIFDHKYWFTCTTCDTSPTTYQQISLCKLANQTDSGKIAVEQLTPLHGPNPKRCEKNWLPFIKNNQLLLLYSYDPLLIYSPDTQTGHLSLVHRWDPKYDFSSFRGSAGPITFDDGYLVMVHQVIEGNNRIYLHRFVFLDQDFKIKKLSNPFTFIHQGIEFCCGMTIDHSGTKLVFPISIGDRKAYIGTLLLDEIRSMLEPLYD